MTRTLMTTKLDSFFLQTVRNKTQPESCCLSHFPSSTSLFEIDYNLVPELRFFSPVFPIPFHPIPVLERQYGYPGWDGVFSKSLQPHADCVLGWILLQIANSIHSIMMTLTSFTLRYWLFFTVCLNSGSTFFFSLDTNRSTGTILMVC